jgi:hypothetical protein
MGLPYTNKYGFSSVRSAHIKAIEGVEKLRKAEPATGAEVKAMYDNMRIGEYLARGFKVKVANLKDTDLFSFAELRNNFGLLDISLWQNVLGGIGDDLIAYYQRLKANGYNLDSKPNCSIRKSCAYGTQYSPNYHHCSWFWFCAHFRLYR